MRAASRAEHPPELPPDPYSTARGFHEHDDGHLRPQDPRSHLPDAAPVDIAAAVDNANHPGVPGHEHHVIATAVPTWLPTLVIRITGSANVAMTSASMPTLMGSRHASGASTHTQAWPTECKRAILPVSTRASISRNSRPSHRLCDKVLQRAAEHAECRLANPG